MISVAMQCVEAARGYLCNRSLFQILIYHLTLTLETQNKKRQYHRPWVYVWNISHHLTLPGLRYDHNSIPAGGRFLPMRQSLSLTS